MNLIHNKNKKLYTFLALLAIFAFSTFITNFTNYPSKVNDLNTGNFLEEPKKTDIPYDNTYEGMGNPWNITHWANRTDYDLSANFGNNSYDLVDIPLDSDWMGYNLKSSVDNLYDSRNWNNGTFHFGANNTYATGADDSLYIANESGSENASDNS